MIFAGDMKEQTPLLALRMRSLSCSTVLRESDEILDCLRTMMTLDEKYCCRDYLDRRRKHKEGKWSTEERLDVCENIDNEYHDIDTSCREKMVEWSYRVCDHFQASREIVAFAFAFLDRFVDRYSCDRTTFKLASMTCLYLATKMFSLEQISITSLAELSRGEFEVSHISEMERIILETLQWRLNPPTAQAYILRLTSLIHTEDSVVRVIQRRGVFFSELCVYDYAFVTQEKYLIAVACILNAMDCLEDTRLSRKLKSDFTAILLSNLGHTVDMYQMEAVQARIWYLYECSAEVEGSLSKQQYILGNQLSKRASIFHENTHAQSPVSVQSQSLFRNSKY